MTGNATAVRDMQTAIFLAIEGYYRDTGSGSLNDVLSALAAAEARYLASITDRNLRRSTVKAMDAVRDEMMAIYQKQGGGPKVQTIVMPGRTN